MKEKIVKYWNYICKVFKYVSSGWRLDLATIIGAFLFGAFMNQYAYNSIRESEIITTKIENVKEFIEHPNYYKLDTLYRKSGDTLFIDTIKIKYLK